MSPEPQIKVLSARRREWFFWALVLVFLIALPSLIFYTTGYRLSFENEETSIVTTGGIYITTDNLEVDVFLDEEQVERPRLFRSAYYIQNISAGQHRIVVQRPDLHTWVKELPVDPYIVTEAAAFNMPILPHLRPITEYVADDGVAVYQVATTTVDIFANATSTESFQLSTSTATSTLELNEEFVFVTSLFSTTSTSSVSVFERMRDQMDLFRFATTSTEDATTSTSTQLERIRSGDAELIEREGELYARWNGNEDTIPYYYCVTPSNASSTINRYGEHVQNALNRIRKATSTDLFVERDRVCRPEIKLDRLRMDVFYYEFFPNNADLVLLHLEDGVYVTEIDDRAWQNSQPLYLGDNLSVVVENESIFVKDGEWYFEIITEIEPPE